MTMRRRASPISRLASSRPWELAFAATRPDGSGTDRRGDIWRALPQILYAYLSQTIELELAGDSGSPADALDVEIAAHASFAEDRRRQFTGRADVLRVVGSYLAAPANVPLFIHGGSGSGKSTVMARAIADAPAGADVVYRFIGAVPGSTRLPVLLDGLCTSWHGSPVTNGPPPAAMCRARPGIQPAPRRRRGPPPHRDVPRRARSTIASHGARSLNWLPATLPDGVRLVVSTVNDDVRDALAGRVPASHGTS